jgi:hypothetical protein
MPPVLKRAGLPIEYEPWKISLASYEDDIDFTLVDADAEKEWRDWLDTCDEKPDIVFNDEDKRRMGIRLAGQPPRMAMTTRGMPGVVNIRSFLRG